MHMPEVALIQMILLLFTTTQIFVQIILIHIYGIYIRKYDWNVIQGYNLLLISVIIFIFYFN